MTRSARWWRLIANILLLVAGIVLSPLRAVAATVPVLSAYDAAVQPTAATAFLRLDAVRPERDGPPEYAYDAVHVGYDGAANAQMVARAGAIRPYGRPLNFPNWHEVGEGVIYDALTATTAAEETTTLFHYTTEEGMNGILESGELNASTKALNPADARYGNGQYLSDIAPGTMTPAQLSRQFLGMPFQGSRFTNWVETDVSGLNVVQRRAGVFVVPNEGPLNLAGRIVGSGGGP